MAFLSSAASAAASAMRCASLVSRSGRNMAAVALASLCVARAGFFSAFSFFFMCSTSVRAMAESRSSANLALAEHYPFFRRQALEPHRPVGVELRGRNPDFGTEPELAAVVEAGGGVHQHAARVDFAQEALRVLVRARDDRLGVIRAVTLDVLERGAEARHHANRDDLVQELAPVVVFARELGLRHERARPLVAPELYAGIDERLRHAGQYAGRSRLVNQEALERVTSAGPNRLGVHDDR